MTSEIFDLPPALARQVCVEGARERGGGTSFSGRERRYHRCTARLAMFLRIRRREEIRVSMAHMRARFMRARNPRKTAWGATGGGGGSVARLRGAQGWVVPRLVG